MTKEIDKIIVLKSTRRMHLLSGDSVIKKYKIALGKNPKGHKEFEGDNKTPEGLYFIDAKNSKSKFHKNLGVSYPNEVDITKAKLLRKSPGGLIKIHGLPNKKGWLGKLHLLRNWTAGCIAVTNNEIDEIYTLVKVNTPIEILP